MLNFLFVAKVSLLGLKLVVFIGTLLAEPVSSATSEPSTNMALNFQSDCLPLFVPHCWGHILFRVDDFVISLINIDARFFHLNSKFSHHLSRLCLVLVSLNLSLNLIGMVVASLISLSERMVVSDAWSIVSETTEISLRSLLFLNSYCHDFDLIISEANFDIELIRHDKFVSFNRIIVVLLLLSHLVPLLHHLFLHLLLLERL